MSAEHTTAAEQWLQKIEGNAILARGAKTKVPTAAEVKRLVAMVRDLANGCDCDAYMCVNRMIRDPYRLQRAYQRAQRRRCQKQP